MSIVKYQLTSDGIREVLNKGLSRREIEILEATLTSTTYKEVGQKLFISDKTVKFHMTSIFKKMTAKNKSQLLLKLHKYLERKIEQITLNNLPKGK